MSAEDIFDDVDPPDHPAPPSNQLTLDPSDMATGAVPPKATSPEKMLESDDSISICSLSDDDLVDLLGTYDKDSAQVDSLSDSEPACQEVNISPGQIESHTSGELASSETSGASVRKTRKRAKRGGFKKGYLKQKKRARRAQFSAMPGDAAEQQAEENLELELGDGQEKEKDQDQNQDRTQDQSQEEEEEEEEEEVFIEIVTENFELTSTDINNDDDDNERCTSRAETTFSEPTDYEEVGQEDLSDKGLSKKRRKRKSIGRTPKYAWKAETDNETQETQQETVHDETSTGVDSVDKKDSLIGSTPSTTLPLHQDKSIDANEKDLLKKSMPTTIHSPESLSWISTYLKLTLESCWTVSSTNNSIMICKIMNAKNPFVERAVTWDGERMHIIIHGKEIDINRPLWMLGRNLDLENLGSIVDNLTFLCTRIMFFNICTGCEEHQEIWSTYSNQGKGTAEFFKEVPAFRSTECKFLTLSVQICSHCRSLYKKMSRLQKNNLGKGVTDAALKKTNNRYLLQDQLERKMKLIIREKKSSDQKVKRMTVRIKKLLKDQSVSVNEEFGTDFANILNENIDKMSELEKLFWQQQSEALKKRGAASRTMRWHPAMIRLALHLRMLSPAAYDYLRGFISLPCQRRLFDYSQFTEIQEGVQQELLEHLQREIEKQCSDEKDKYFSLLLDEMSIRSNLVFNSRTGELVGYTNLSSLESSMRELEAEIEEKNYEKRLAKKVLVYMLNGATKNIRFVPAVFSTDDLSASQLYMRTWDVIYAVEESGAKVLTVIFDGASMNKKFLSMNFNASEKPFSHQTINTASGDSRDLYFMLDPPHLIKTFRNCLANSYSHRNSRKLWKDGQDLSWKAIEALYEITKGDKFQGVKLSKAHVKLTSFSCMKVNLATQALSGSVANALENFKDVSPLKEVYSDELVRLIKLVNRAFDCFNGSIHSKKKDANSDLDVYRTVHDDRFAFLQNEFLGFLSDWESSISRRKGKFTKEEKSRMIISHQTLEGFKITIASFVKIVQFLLLKGVDYVSARDFNQDPLEQYFSIIRRMRGSDNHPDLKQFGHSRLALQEELLHGYLSSSSKGNTEAVKRHLDTIDDSPVPVRKRKN